MRALSVSRLAGLLLVAGALASAAPSAALAAPPSNDNFADATVIGSVPFSTSVDTTEATTEPDEPGVCSAPSQTVWYSFTPTVKTAVQVDLGGVFQILTVFRSVGSGFGGLSFLGCIGPGSTGITAEAGTTYYIQVGNAGIGQLDLTEIPAPANDDFANATPITTLPFSDSVNPAASGIEADEPRPSCRPNPVVSVWYAFTAGVTGSLTARGEDNIAIYTGSALTGLSELACGHGALLTFRANAGTTYYFQVSSEFAPHPLFGRLTFNLDVAGDPVANFIYFPGEPSIFEDVQFIDQTFDPGQAGFQSRVWDFGDNTVGVDCCPAHRYTADGDYTVRLTVTTLDGRTASTSQIVHVRTHDVAITKLDVPDAGRVGRSQQITVGVNNTRYPETVEVQLYRSTPAGFELVESQRLPVPVRAKKKTTDFVFYYTFTADDAATGKVSFKAIAILLTARDALPADNEAIAPPIKVKH